MVIRLSSIFLPLSYTMYLSCVAGNTILSNENTDFDFFERELMGSTGKGGTKMPGGKRQRKLSQIDADFDFFDRELGGSATKVPKGTKMPGGKRQRKLSEII